MSKESITVSKTFKLTIKGQEIELTADEAKALAVAINAAIDGPKAEVDVHKIARDVERRNRRDNRDYPPIPWPISQPLPDPAPTWPLKRPEIWCSTNGFVRMSVQ